MIKHSPNYTNKVYPYYVGNTIVTDSSGSVFIGTYWDGLYRYDGENWHVYDTSNSGLLNNNINAIALKNNGLWLGSELGVVDFTNFGSGKRVSNLRDTVASVDAPMTLYNVKLFPNPSNGEFTIESQESQELDY
jgi:ligand-binding sensor domain-containing protein